MSKFMTGALLGIAVGLLVAPEKGEDTREALTDNYEKLKDKVLKLTGRAGARIDDLKGLLGKEIEGVSDDVRSRINTILEEESSRMSADNAGGKDANTGNTNTGEGSRAGRAVSGATTGGGAPDQVKPV